MSQENVEIVSRAFIANSSADLEETIDVAMSLTHRDCELTSRLNAVDGTIYRGLDGIRQYFVDLADAFQEWTNEVHAIEDLGPNTVLADATFRGVGRSGVAVELRSASVWVLDDGKVVRVQIRGSREEALQAAGLS